MKQENIKTFLKFSLLTLAKMTSGWSLVFHPLLDGDICLILGARNQFFVRSLCQKHPVLSHENMDRPVSRLALKPDLYLGAMCCCRRARSPAEKKKLREEDHISGMLVGANTGSSRSCFICFIFLSFPHDNSMVTHSARRLTEDTRTRTHTHKVPELQPCTQCTLCIMVYRSQCFFLQRPAAPCFCREMKFFSCSFFPCKLEANTCHLDSFWSSASV